MQQLRFVQESSPGSALPVAGYVGALDVDVGCQPGNLAFQAAGLCTHILLGCWVCVCQRDPGKTCKNGMLS